MPFVCSRQQLAMPNTETHAALEESRALMAAQRVGFANAEALFAYPEKNSRK